MGTVHTNKHNEGTSTSEKKVTSIRESVQSLVDQGTETVATIRSHVGEVTDEAKTKSSAVYDRTVELITANPLKSLVLAFGLGYVAMRIRTSKLTPFIMIGGLGYLGTKLLRR